MDKEIDKRIIHLHFKHELYPVIYKIIKFVIMNEKKEVSKRVILIIATVASFLTPFMGSSVNVALPTIAYELSANVIRGFVERRFYGVASATTSTMRIVGQTLSMGMVLVIFLIY